MHYTKTKPIFVMAIVCVGILISSQAAVAHGTLDRNNGAESGMMGGQYGSGMMGGQYGSDMMGGQYGSDMMGGQYGSDMMGGQYGSDMMGGQYGSGMMGGQYGLGMMGGRYGSGMMGNFAMLDLTDEQVGKVTKEQDRFRKKAWEIIGLELDEQPMLREALAADVPDPIAVGQAYGKLFDLKRQMIEERIISANKIRSLLNEDQLNILKNGRSEPNRYRDNMQQRENSGMGSNMMQGQGNQ